MDEVIIKVIETKKIPIDKIDLGNIQARTTDVTKNLEVFAEQIRPIGLIQPIVVYPKDDRYEMIVGQRRYYAHRDILKWDEILAMIIEKPENDMMAATISWIENEARMKMSNRDKIRHVANLYSEQTPMAEISKILGITYKEVKSCIGMPRVPDVVRMAVEKGEINPNIAVRATDAKNFDKGITPETEGNDVLDLAKEIQNNTLTEKELDNMKEYAVRNPNSSNDTLLSDGIENVMEQLTIDLLTKDLKRLEKFAEENDMNKNSAAKEFVLEGLDQTGD